MLWSTGTTNKMAEDVSNSEWRVPGVIVRLPQRLRLAEYRGIGTMTTDKMAFYPCPTSFSGTHTPSCPQPSASVIPDGSRSPSAALPMPFLLFRNNGKVKRNEDYKQDGGRGADT